MEPSSAAKKTPGGSRRKARSLCLPFASEAAYARCVADRAYYRRYLMEQYQQHPELFPSGWAAGFHFHGVVQSKKQGLRQCRVKLKSDGSVYQLRPSFMMPYMIGRTQMVEKPLFLRRWGVPFEALAYVFGRDPMYWYRAYVSLGRLSVVGTTIKTADHLPAHVIADEKHTRWRGHRVFIPTTVADNCILGAEVVPAADTETLTQGYQGFQAEAQQLHADYAPQTVNTDGWKPTQAAWKTLFPSITLVLCFLHAVLAIKKPMPKGACARLRRARATLAGVCRADLGRVCPTHPKTARGTPVPSPTRYNQRQSAGPMRPRRRLQSRLPTPRQLSHLQWLGTVDELSTSAPVDHAILSWNPTECNLICTGDGPAVEFPSLWTDNPTKISHTGVAL